MRVVVVGAAWICVLLGTIVRADTLYDEPTAGDDESQAICDSCDPCAMAAECECCDCICDCQRLFGMLPSDDCFDSFISPLSNPFFFEDPRSLTEVRGIFIENSLPNAIGSGDAQAYSLQLRGRLTERLSVIAPRLGYISINEAGGAPKGMMSAPVGIKYNFYRNVEDQELASAGITYFIPENLSSYFPPQDGDFHIFLTGGKQIGDWGHWLSATGFRLPLDKNWGTQFWYWSNQWDYEVAEGWYAVAGVNWFHWMSGSTVIGSTVSGLDLVNVPADVAGRNLVSGVLGLKWKPSRNVELGSGFEFPLTTYNDILRNRLYADVIFRY